MILDIEGILDCPSIFVRNALLCLSYFSPVYTEIMFVDIQGEVGPEGNICISWTP